VVDFLEDLLDIDPHRCALHGFLGQVAEIVALAPASSAAGSGAGLRAAPG